MPTQGHGREGGLVKPWVRRDIAKLRRGKGLHSSIAVLRRGVATVHSMEIFVFCFVLFFRYFRGLIYWTNEDPISV